MVRKTYWVAAICGLLAPALRADFPVTADTTATQAILHYKSPIPGACSVKVSEAASYAPLVNDVNPALYTGSDADSGALDVNGERLLVVGQRRIDRALDGKFYSRALQANTEHFAQITCGAAQGTTRFVTVNPPLGSPPEVPLFDGSSFGNYAQPTVDFHDPDKTYIDPLTGILLKRVTSPGDEGDASAQGQTFSAVQDKNSVWGGVANIVSNGAFATYGGSGIANDYLFLTAPLNLGGLKGFSAKNVLLDVRVQFNGYGTGGNSGDRTLSGCLSTDNGQSCATAAVDLPSFPQGSSQAAIRQFPPANYPSPIFSQWMSAGGTPPITPNMQTRSGTVSVTGAVNVVWTGGDTLQDLVPGDAITIAGSGCAPGGQCLIASVTDAKHLVLSAPSANVAGAAYTSNNFGLKVWKKTASGTIGLNTARFDWTSDTQFGMPAGGETSHCSSNQANTTADRNGSPLGRTQPGFLCLQEDQYGNARLYWIGTNGESRHISNLVRPAVTSPAADAINHSTAVCFISNGVDPLGLFDATDPNKVYCAGNRTGTPPAFDVIYSCIYNPQHSAYGNYREWSSGFNVDAENPAISCQNITKASQKKDLTTQIRALIPGYDINYFGSIGPGNVKGNYFTLVSKVQQDSIGYFFRFLTLDQTVTQAVSSWTGPIRWGGIHGPPANATPNFGALYIVPLRSPGAAGIGRYQIQITSIAGGTGTGLTSTYEDAQTCEQRGVTNPAFISGGASGNHCIVVNVAGEPYNPTPHAIDLAKFPHPNNATSCGGDGSTSNCWSKLTDAVEGDFLIDNSSNGFGEKFRLVKKLSPGTWVLQRGVVLDDCSGPRLEAHANGWTPIMYPRGECNAVFNWIGTSGQVYVDAATMNSSHHDVLTDALTDAGVYVQSGYDLRSGPFPDQIGKPANFHSLGSYAPKFAGSSASLSVEAIQSHPSARQHIAAPNEFRWMLDGRPYGGALGGANSLFYQQATTTAIPGVYRVSPPTDQLNGAGNVLSTLDRKRLPLQVWAGRYLMKDKSGPGSVLSSVDAWMYCVADFAGECVAGSSAGQVFMNVPQADLSGVCQSNFEINTPCWVSASPVAPFITQVGIDKPDTTGSYWRRISNYFSGIGWTDNFWNARPLPDASWAFTVSPWLNGTHTELLIAKLPPWPAERSSGGPNFTTLSKSYGPVAGSLRRVRFGYDTNLFCTSRQEQCSTAGGPPFNWIGEAQTWTACGAAACQITIPALPGRVVYYVEDFDDGTGHITSSAMKVEAVP